MMLEVGRGNDNSYAEYRREMELRRTLPYVRTGALVTSAVNVAFVWLDYFAFRDQFFVLLPGRLLLAAVLALLFFRTGATHPRASKWAMILATGLMLLSVIYGTGEPATTGYYAGLILFLVGFPVLLPMSVGEALLVCGLFVAAFAAAPLAPPPVTDWEAYVSHVIFLVAAGLVSCASTGLLDRTRYRDFVTNRGLEQARDDLKELDRAKSRFTANMHHELRTPLTLILAPLDALRSEEYGQLPEQVQSTLRTMHVNGKRLLKLINNLLDLAKLESRGFEITRRDVDVREVIEDVVAGATSLAERKQIELATDVSTGLGPLYADIDALDKVLVNLLGNALKFTEPGGRIEVSARPEAGGTLVCVKDDGIGIAPDALDQVFDRFAQLDGSTTRRHEGTGIGLSLTRELVELHSGRIWAESEGEGQGTRMCVWLPEGEPDADVAEEVVIDDSGAARRLGESMAAAEAELNLEDDAQRASDSPLIEMERSVERWEGATRDAAEGGDAQRRPAAASAGGPGPNAPEILIAEDNPDMRKLLQFLLSREYRVRVTRNGREALEAVREREPCLVLTDVMMPEMSGTELCAAIKEDEATRGIPVVLVTSKAERDMKIEGLELGADDYVTKPFHPRELLARVRSLVRIRNLQEELFEQNASLERALEELRRAEVQLVHSARLAAVGEMAAGIAHEVNNPVNFSLNAVRALRLAVTDLQRVAERTATLEWDAPDKLEYQVEGLQAELASLGAQDLSGSIGEMVDIITEGLGRTARLVGDLRDFAAPGRRATAQMDVRKGLLSTIQLLSHSLAEQKVKVDLRIPEALPPIQGDAGAINQIFLNLLKNAAEAFGDTGGSIVIEGSADSGMLQLYFRDDGPGIPIEVRDRLFEPFFTTKEAGRGTGLGLPISRQIAEAHHGSLELVSSTSEGTTFALKLPATDPLGQEDDRAS